MTLFGSVEEWTCTVYTSCCVMDLHGFNWIVCATLRISLLGLQFPGQMESGCWVPQRFQDKSHRLVTFFLGQDRLLADF